MNASRAMRRFALIALCAPFASLSAQLAELQPGTKVRVRAPGEVAGRLTGVVIARSADSLTVTRVNASPLTIPVARISSFEVSRGKSRSRGALKGMAWGGGIGLLMGLTNISDSTCSGGTRDTRDICKPISRGEFMGQVLLGSVAIGAGIGALVGSERWDRGLMPTRVAMLAPSRTRTAGLMLSWVAKTPRRKM